MSDPRIPATYRIEPELGLEEAAESMAGELSIPLANVGANPPTLFTTFIGNRSISLDAWLTARTRDAVNRQELATVSGAPICY